MDLSECVLRSFNNCDHQKTFNCQQSDIMIAHKSERFLSKRINNAAFHIRNVKIFRTDFDGGWPRCAKAFPDGVWGCFSSPWKLSHKIWESTAQSSKAVFHISLIGMLKVPLDGLYNHKNLKQLSSWLMFGGRSDVKLSQFLKILSWSDLVLFILSPLKRDQ